MSPAPIRRRALVQGAAWSAPVVLASTAVPAYAASTSTSSFAGLATELAAISFTGSQAVFDSLAPRIRFTDITNKRLEISRRTGRPFASVTEAEARAELQPELLKATGLEDQFNRSASQAFAQATLEAIARNPLYAHLKGQELQDRITTAIGNRKEQFLLGLAYIRSLYSFNLGGLPLAETLISNPEHLGVAADPISYILNIGSRPAATLAFTNSPANHRTLLRLPELTSFLANRAGTSDMNAWMRDTSRTIIADAADPLYSKLAGDPNTHRYILPLLSQQTDGVFVATTPATITIGHTYTYVNPASTGPSPEKTAFIEDLNRRAAQQAAFIELWARLVPAQASQLKGNRFAIDTLQGYQASNISASWLPKTHPGAISNFFTPLGLWTAYLQASAQAEGLGMRYFMAKAISDNGITTYGHEMTHLIDDTVLTNGHGLREGFGPETIARGIFEGPDTPTASILGFNQYFDWSGAGDRLHNASPAQFTSKQDLSTYTRNQLDTLYLLDALEAEAILRRSAEERSVLLNRLTQTPRTGTGHSNDTFSTITPAEAGALTSLEDFTTQGLVVSRYQWRGISTTGTAPANSYYTIPLFDPAYGAYTPTTGSSGDITVRRQAFDLLAYKGYDEGLVPYISNQYRAAAGGALSDSFIMGQIGIADYAAERAGRYRQGLDRAASAGVFPFAHGGQTITSLEDLRAQFDRALAADLPHLRQARAGSASAIWSVTAVRDLKASFYRAALAASADFTRSLFA